VIKGVTAENFETWQHFRENIGASNGEFFDAAKILLGKDSLAIPGGILTPEEIECFGLVASPYEKSEGALLGEVQKGSTVSIYNLKIHGVVGGNIGLPGFEISTDSTVGVGGMVGSSGADAVLSVDGIVRSSSKSHSAVSVGGLIGLCADETTSAGSKSETGSTH